jgi:glycosyltransferase involved in cell wall biosynthesis
MKRKVLYVLHNHPDVRPGGAEAYGLELYRAMKRTAEIEPILVARIGQSGDVSPPRHAGAPFSTVGGDPNEYFVFTDTDVCDFFFDTYRDKTLYTTYFADFIRTYKPDVVHFQHTHFIGYDVVTLVRRMLPQTPIVYTLHEFLPMCHRQGQLVRTTDEGLCLGPSPRKCNECFPEWTPQNFFLRDRLVKRHLAQVDRFLAPSKFLLERYVDWGIPREKLMFEDYGRIPQTRFEAPVEARLRTRIGFFGQISPYKGVEILLDAMHILAEQAPDVHLVLHGANLDVLPDDQRETLVTAIETSGANVTFAGPYAPDDVPRLMSQIDWVVVPSRWWENSPLVIQEAFMHGRPVICSGIGGMAEKVTHDVNGLHFPVSQPDLLAETIRLAVSTPGLWERLRDGIPQIYRMDDHVVRLGALYEELIAERAASQVHDPTAIADTAV